MRLTYYPALCPPEFLRIAHSLADAAGEILRRYFRTPVAVDVKPDDSPVTAADREAEAAIREILSSRRPADGVVGEEFGSENADAEFVWVVDPIDGTRSFIAGRPIFGTLIAVLSGGVPVLGVIDQPVAGERWTGCFGGGALLNDVPISTRACAKLADGLLATTSPHLFASGKMERFRRIESRARHAIYGGDCYNYGLLAAGHLDAVVESGLKPYDFCALAPIVREAGGRITDWSGEPLSLSSNGDVVAAGDARLHAEALSLLGASAQGQGKVER